MVALHRQTIRSIIRTTTLLAALTSLLLTMVTPFVGTAHAGTTPPAALGGSPTDGVLNTGLVGPLSDSACGSGDDTQPIGGNVKLDDIQDEAPPVIESKTLGTGKSDLCDLWYKSAVDADGDVWLYLALRRFSANGSQVTYVELFDESPTCAIMDIAGCNPFESRDQGSRVIAFDFQGNDAIIDAQIRTWNAGTSTFGPLTPIGGAADGKTFEDGIYAELAINLSDAGILDNVNETDECDLIAAALPYTVTGNSDQASMIDILLADIEPISNCGAVTVVKKDAAEGNTLAGAKYRIYRDTGTIGVLDGETAIDDCETGNASNPCTFTDLPAGDYLVEEYEAPPWYAELSGADAVESVSVTVGQTASVTFVNPPIPVRINVTPDSDTNAVGNAHRFTVTIEQNPSLDGSTWVPVDATYGSGDGQFEVSWAGVSATVDTSPTGGAEDCSAGTGADGTCVVDVTADEAGQGVLTGTFHTAYQFDTGAPATDPANQTSTAASVSDTGAKAWRGLDLTITPPDAENLVGDAHTFTVTVYELDGTEAAVTDGTPKDDADVDGTFTHPDGTVEDVGCNTGGDGQGTCDITVTSTDAGEGTLEITSVTGDIVGNAVEELVVEFTQQERTALKTWVDFRVSVTPPSETNYVGWDHTFEVLVERDAGDGFAPYDAEAVAWSWDGEDATTDTCTDGTDGDGTCTLVFPSGGNTGTYTLEIDTIDVWIDLDGDGAPTPDEIDTVDANGGSALTADAVTAEKTWVDYNASLEGDEVNLLGDDHTFTVSVDRTDGGNLDDTTVTLGWEGPVGSTVTTDLGSATTTVAGERVEVDCDLDAGGECDVTVDSDATIGTGTLSVLEVVDDSVVVGDLTAGKTFEFGNATTTATKTWKIYRVTMSEDATNLVGDDHPFEVTAWSADGLTDGGEPDWQVYEGATLDFGWTGPGTPDPISCTTADDGTCTVTVSSSEVAEGTLTVTGDAIGVADDDPIVLADDSRTAPLAETDDATKTWIAIAVDIEAPATNRVGTEHTFPVSIVVQTPDGDVPAPVGTSLSWTLGGDLADTATVTTDCDDTANAGTCSFLVNSDDGGTLTIAIDDVTFVHDDQTFGPVAVGDVAFVTERSSTSKTWIDYGLAITPQDATNLLPVDPDHPLVVTLTSSGGAPVGGQDVDLLLWSDNGAEIVGGEAALEDEPGTWLSLGECTTTDAGTCAVTITADTPGDATLVAEYTFDTDDGEFTISTSEFPGPGGNGQDADKTWTTYDVDVDGPAINLLGSPHTFTVTVTQDGTDPVVGAVFAQGDAEGSSIAISDAKDAATIDGGTCFTTGTDDAGQCTVEVSSTATTLATLSVSYLGEAADSQSTLFTDDSTKQWVDYRLDVSPDTADNLVDTDHVFTVDVEMDLGDEVGWQPVPDGSEVALALTGVGAITSVGDGGTIDADGLGGTCMTVDGQCLVTITSPDAGQSSLVATYTGVATNGEITNADESAQFGDEPAEKHWVDYALTMNEDAVNPIGTTHTFTATLTTDTGDGFGPAAGEELTFSIEGVGEVIEVEDGTVDDDGRGGTCTTDVDGTCDIVIASDQQGATTVTATYGAVVGETSRDFADDAVKTWVSNPAIDLVKDVDVTEAAIGDIATYTYTITNTGDVTLTNVRLVDEVEVSGILRDLLELLGFDTTITLEPGESTSITSIHLVTEDDLPGPIDNVATVTGEAPDGEEVTDTDDERVTPFGEPGIALDKVVAIPGADPDAPIIGVDPDVPGDTVIPYEFEVTNTGNVTLTDVTLTDIVLTEIPAGDAPTFDEAQGVDGVVIGVELDDTTLAPAQSTTGTLLYQVRAEDVANAVVVNVAEVTGVDPSGTTVRDEDPAFVSLQFPDVEVPPTTVVEPAPTLPATGFETMRLALWAALVAGLGALLLLLTEEAQVARRRRD